MDTDSLWINFLADIKENISSLSYDTWFRDTKLVSLTNNIATIVVPMPVHKKHLLENYKDISNLKKISIGLDVSKIILLLSDDNSISDNYISNLINMGFYNFAKNENEIKYLYDNPNSYKDVDYITDNIKDIVLLDTTKEKNQYPYIY